MSGDPTRLPVRTTVVDLATGLETESVAYAHIMPPTNPDACKMCGRVHPPEQPHDATLLHYQYSFYAEHGRWPTWKDAVAHCTPSMQAAWEAELRRRGAWSEPTPGE